MIGTFSGTVTSDSGSVWTVLVDTIDGEVLIAVEPRIARDLIGAWQDNGPFDLDYEAWQVVG